MYLRFVLLSLIFSFFCIVIFPQQSSLGGILQQYNLSSGLYDGSNLKKPTNVYSKIISLPNISWIQVRFNSVNLGKNSYLTIESVEDNSRQVLNSVDIEQWDLSSAFFNGDSLLISLYAGPGDKNIFFNITEIFIGESAAQSFINAPNQPNGVEDFCSTDNRNFQMKKQYAE